MGGEEQELRRLHPKEPSYGSTSKAHVPATTRHHHHIRKIKTPYFVYLVVFMAVIGGFLFGYDCGVVSGAMIVITEVVPGVDQDWQALLVSITVASAAVFSLVGGVSNDYLGRKPTTLIASALFTIGSIELGASPLQNGRIALLCGRIIVGAAIGMSSMTVPSYIAEAAPPHIRGTLVTLFQLSITVGFFFAGVMDGAFYYVGNDNWRYMFGIAAIPALVQLVGFFFMPESPRWLAIHGKKDQAFKVLMMLTQDEEVANEELDDILESQRHGDEERAARGGGNVLVSMLTTPPVRRALILGCVMQMFQQLCGINTVMYYSASIVKMGGVRSESADIWFTCLTSGVNMLMTLPGLYLVERLGRKILVLISMAGVILSCVLLAIGFILIQKHTESHAQVTPYSPSNFSSLPIDIPKNYTDCMKPKISSCDDCSYHENCGYCLINSTAKNKVGSCFLLDPNDKDFTYFGPCAKNVTAGKETGWILDTGFCPTPYSALPIVGMVLYLCSFSCGFGPVPWTVNSEIYPHWARSTGNALATATNWAFNLLISYTFLRLANAITRQGAFFLYAGITSLGFIVFLLFLPETKNKTLEEIEDLFTGPVITLFNNKSDKEEEYPADPKPYALDRTALEMNNKGYEDDEKF